ncbi:hypothetical protein BD410DRAFT_792127 [Rickenella mellea]|uniref:Uncharacterized protein n=1 Tax=Rickenella mellea TaxID=50990 RepID=A0A4Y7PWR4_9AGAM|nr:hypothetical protein BD410DRAFT_792127 [Rickenella mellea]
MAQRRIADLEDARLGKLYGVLQRERARSCGESPSLSDTMAMDSPKQPARLEAFGMDFSATHSSSSTLNVSVEEEENLKDSKVGETPRSALADKSNIPGQPGAVEAT